MKNVPDEIWLSLLAVDCLKERDFVTAIICKVTPARPENWIKIKLKEAAQEDDLSEFTFSETGLQGSIS